MIRVEVRIGTRCEQFVLAQTSAPQAYDHGDAIRICDASYEGVVERYVLVPADAMEWQRGRNRSGLHTLETDELLVDEADVTRELWKRLYGRE